MLHRKHLRKSHVARALLYYRNRRPRLRAPERLEDRAAPGGGLAGVMAAGGLAWWLGDPWAGRDTREDYAPEGELLSSGPLLDSPQGHLGILDFGGNRPDNWLSQAASRAEPVASEIAYSPPLTQTDVSMEAYRPIAPRVAGPLVDRLFADKLDPWAPDLSWADPRGPAHAPQGMHALSGGRAVPAAPLRGGNSMGAGGVPAGSQSHPSDVSQSGVAAVTPSLGFFSLAGAHAAAAQKAPDLESGLDLGPLPGFSMLGEGNEPPVAEDDEAFVGNDVTVPNDQRAVTIWVLENDYDPDDGDFWITSAGPAGKGTVSVSASQQSVTYVPDASFTSGDPDTFEYTIEDDQGGTGTAEVTVTIVEVGGYNLQREDVDGDWVDVLGPEISWSHDPLRWLPQFGPTEPPEPGVVEWYKKPWAKLNDPGEPWKPYAYGDDATIWTYGEPGVGEWAITPRIYMSHDPQTEFWTTFTSATAKRRLVAGITDIDWVTHANAAEAGELVDHGPGDLRLYPDAPQPGDPARVKVDVLIQVEPKMAGIPLVVRWYDVDDPSDHDGPIDLDPGPPPEYPDWVAVNNADNFSYPPSSPSEPWGPIGTGTTDANGQERRIFTIAGWIQPGNNWRFAAGGRQEELERVKPQAEDSSSSLFFDQNMDGWYNQGDEETFDETTFEHGIRVTPRLTVWRKLHVEVDPMGAVAGNTVHDTSGAVTENPDGTYHVPLVTGGLEENRFENGTLQDFQGYIYEVVNNASASLTVRISGNPMPPMSNADVWFWDDDHLHDGQDVPEPDIGLLPALFLPAYVIVITPPDGGGNPGNNQSNLAFDLNVDDAERSSQRLLGKDALSTEPYWVIYLQGAFQGPVASDNDPHTESGLLGTTQRGEGALLYLETIQDVAREHSVDANVAERQTVGHEVGHEFGLPDRSGAGRGIMRNDVVIVPPEEEKFIEEDLAQIRKQPKAN